MRQLGITNCEREFILQSFLEDLRTDGRKCDEYRRLRVTLGQERGSCFVELGSTKVFCQVSADIVVPKAGKPSTGEIFINVEMSPMAAPNFEPGRLGDRGIEITRMLERILKESICVDVESLCIISGEKVWEIRIDVHVIDHDGAILDCASVASICALKSYRRPDVTIVGENFILHPIEDKEPVPLNIFHVPVCMTFGLTEHGNSIIVDPTEREEHVFEGEVVVAMNSHKELCAVHCTGGMLLQKAQILRCCSMASRRAKEVSDIINEVFQKDAVERSQKKKIGFSSLINLVKISTASFSLPVTNLNANKSTEVAVVSQATAGILSTPQIRKKGKVVQIGSRPSPLMTQMEDSDDEVTIISEIIEAKPIMNDARGSAVQENVENKKDSLKKPRRKPRKEENKEVLQLLMDMEEDVAILTPETKKKPEKVDLEDGEIVEEINLSAALKTKKRTKLK